MSAPKYRRIVAVDFDGTLAETRFPEIIKPIQKNIAYCKLLKRRGAILILWTCRCGKDLTDAVEFCATQGLEFDYINENTPENIEKYKNDCRKINADEYFDDKGINPNRESYWARRVLKAYRMPIMLAMSAICTAAAAVAAVLSIRALKNK